MIPTWNIMTRSRGGTVSLLKNLTEDEARRAMQRLRKPSDFGDPWGDLAISRRVDQELSPSRRQYSWFPSDGDLEQIECWSSDGAELVVWPKPEDYEERYAAELERARVQKESEVAVVAPRPTPSVRKFWLFK